MYLKLVPLEISVWKPGSEGPTVIKTGGHHLFHLASCQKKKSQHGRMYSIWAGTSVPPTIRPWDSWFLNAVTQTGLTSLASLALSLQVWPWICSTHFLSHWFTLDIVALCLHNHVNQPLTVTHFLFFCVSICPIDFAPPEYTAWIHWEYISEHTERFDGKKERQPFLFTNANTLQSMSHFHLFSTEI